MFDISISQSELGKKIGRFASRAQDGRQVASRLRQLLPTRLNSLKAKHQRGCGGGRALRLALQDREYVGKLDEFVAVRSDALEARIAYETHVMLQNARSSIRAFNRKD